ncbi:MAG: dockerin type I repeat-containing protein, partial [Clostridia bacterium]|nr:dockerin type I repeat-containing protein [Clostridia bacterium]
AKEPTCLELGNVEYWHCVTENGCDQYWLDEALTQLVPRQRVLIGVLDHNLIHVDRVEPGCHYTGNIEYQYCSECATHWTMDGRLTNAKDVILPRLSDVADHYEAKDPTCNSEGNIEYWHCDECDQYWADEALTQLINRKMTIIEKLDHATIIFVEAIAPKCHYTGNIAHQYCPDCRTYWTMDGRLTNAKDVILPRLSDVADHYVAKAPTCLELGNVEYWHCDECDQYWLDEALTQITNAKNVLIEALPHTIVHVDAVPATCDGEGNIEYQYCSVCDTHWTMDGMITNRKNVITPALGHTIVHVDAKAATCTENGNVEHEYCSVCGTHWTMDGRLTNAKNVITPAIGHSYDTENGVWNWNLDADPVTATYTVTCVNCGGTKVYDATVTVVGPDEYGKISYTATVEGDIFVGAVTASNAKVLDPALGEIAFNDSDKLFGHAVKGDILYLDGAAEGITVEELINILSKTGVTNDADKKVAVEVKNAATNGNKKLVPTGATVTLTAENSVGVTASETYTIVVLGDVNCNGLIDNNDAVLMQLHYLDTKKITDALKLDAADVNRNGKLDNNDAVKNTVKYILPEKYKSNLS